MKQDHSPDALYWASFNSFEFRIPGQAILDICHSGDNQPAVQAWLPKINRFEFTNTPTPERIAAELREHGTWEDDELGDDATNWQRIVWIAAWNIYDDEEADCSPPVEPQ